GGAELRTGAWMVRGTIVSLRPIQLLPTFSYACEYNPVFLRLYAKHLQALGFSIPYEGREGTYRRYTGDGSVPGQGEVLVWAANARYRPPPRVGAFGKEPRANRHQVRPGRRTHFFFSLSTICICLGSSTSIRGRSSLMRTFPFTRMVLSLKWTAGSSTPAS